MTKTCTLSGCDRQHYARGWCVLHYQRWLRNGDPLTLIDRAFARNWLIESVASANTDDCIDWPFAVSGTGYGAIKLDSETYGAHRLACELAHGPAPTDRHETAHSCGNRSCVNPHHLRWATPTENQADKIAHGTHNRGERHGRHKLTECDVHRIRYLIASGIRYQRIADRFGVTATTISNINARTSWAWLD